MRRRVKYRRRPVHRQGYGTWHGPCRAASDMGYGDRGVPRGTSRRWEVIVADEERRAPAQRLRATQLRAQHRILQHLEPADLERIPVVAEGERLLRFRQYLDLHDPARADFAAEGDEVVKPGQRVVARADVPRDVWERLVEAAHEVVGWHRRRTA